MGSGPVEMTEISCSEFGSECNNTYSPYGLGMTCELALANLLSTYPNGCIYNEETHLCGYYCYNAGMNRRVYYCCS